MYCCGSNNTDCCNNHQGTFAFQGVPINATSTSSGPHLPGADIAGIVVGAIGILSLIASAYMMIKVRRERRPKTFKTQQQDSVYLNDYRAPDPVSEPLKYQPSTSIRSKPSVRSERERERENHFTPPPPPRAVYPNEQGYYGAEKRLPSLPKEVYEMGGEGISRFEVSGSGVDKYDKKYWGQ